MVFLTRAHVRLCQHSHFSTICFISILIEQFDRQCQSESVNGRTTCRIYPRKEQKKDEVSSSGLCGSITVQRLSANVEGKCQTYSRIGALTLVPLEEEVTLPNIKAACKAHFKTNLERDVLLVNEGLLTQLLARFKTGMLCTSDS